MSERMPVSVLGGGRRADLWLPGAVPVVGLVPMLAERLGVAGHPLLRRADGTALDPDRELAGQVRAGDWLTLEVEEVADPVVHDDPADAVAAAVGELPQWPGEAGPVVARAAASLAVLAGAWALGHDAPSVISVVAGSTGLTLLLGLALLSPASPTEVTVLAVVVGASCGPVLLGPDVGAAESLAAAGLAALLVAVAAAAVPRHRVALAPVAAVALSAVVLGLAVVAAAASLAAVLAVSVASVAVAGGALPRLSLAVTPGVDQPSSAGSVVAAADRVQAGLQSCAGGWILLCGAPVARLGPEGAVLVVLAAAVLLLRARRGRSLPVVAAGVGGGLAGLAVPAAVLLSAPAPRSVMGGVLVLLGASAMAALTAAGSRWRTRLADVAEVGCVAAVLPVTALVLDLPALVAARLGSAL